MLDRDIADSPIMLEKVKNDIYAQNLYAALCNMKWRKPSDSSTGFFSVTWRTAGGIVADLRNNNETYIDWYCSGIALNTGEVPEGTVTIEIEQDLASLGWFSVAETEP